jgi:hypothetical protein
MTRARHGVALKRALALAVLVLSGCASPPPPIVGVEGRDCASVPEFGGAHELRLAPGNAVTVDLDQNTPCWQASDGGKSAYVMFALPDSIEPYLVTVTSPAIGQAIFAPRLLMLDGLGNTQRTMPRDSFTFHGSSLYLGIRAYPGEKYLLVASDPKVVGQQVSQLREGTQATTSSSGGVYFTIHTGFETNQSFTYALNGRIIVSAEPIPKAQ